MPKKILTEEERFKVLQWASSDFTTDQFPDTWEDMSAPEQTMWLSDHCWEFFENTDTAEVNDIIYTSAERTIKLIEYFINLE